MNYRTEDEVRDSSKLILGFDKTELNLSGNHQTDFKVKTEYVVLRKV